MASARWTKLLRDARAERGRLALMVAAVAVSLAGIGAVLGAYAVLTREVAANYLGTHPAAATLEVPSGVDGALVAAVRGLPGVADAEAREVVVARARVGGAWRRLLLFVIDDFADLRLNTFRRERGAWPPPDGAMLVERSATGVLEADVGGRVMVKTTHGAPVEVPVAGVVHDPGLAPGWQEQSGYGYITRATLARLGEAPALGELRVAFAGAPVTAREVELRAAEVARRVAARGHAVTELRVPPVGQHPHQRQMVTVLTMLLAFASMGLVLSAILVASAVDALLARQVREIGVLKTLGATAGQVAGLYAALVGAVGVTAAVLAAPLGLAGTHLWTRAVARLLNLELTDAAVPAWVLAVELVAGVAVPLAISAVPIRRAARRTVREVMDDHGVPQGGPPRGAGWLPLALRSALRRPGRLALTLGLLAAGGATAITALQLKLGWDANVAKVYATRRYDVEVSLADPVPAGIADRLRAVPGVIAVEAWGAAPAAFARPGELDVARTYPDRGHGAFTAMGVPPETARIAFPLRAGRWLEPGDRDGDALVLNHVALAQSPGLRLGDPVSLSVNGRPTRWRLVGVVEEIGAAGVAYVADAAFARALETGGGVRVARVATAARSPAERGEVIRGLDAALAAAAAPVVSIQPLAELRTAMGDHIRVLVRVLQALAALFGAVGVLGLASALGVSVVERTRELAILKTLGATPARLARMLVAEGLAIAALSYGGAFTLSLPLTWLVGRIVGTLGFLAPLPVVLSPAAALGWIAAGTVATLTATILPARQAARLVVREALGRV